MKRPDELYYEYTTRGYMLYYRGKPIGGAGIGYWAKGSRANLKLFRGSAELDKQMLLAGKGEKRYIDRIHEIDLAEEGE